jgi:exportin-T
VRQRETYESTATFYVYVFMSQPVTSCGMSVEVLEQCVLRAYSHPSSDSIDEFNQKQPWDHQQSQRTAQLEQAREATTRLNSIKSSPVAAYASLQLLLRTRNDTVKFFALSTLQSCLEFPSSNVEESKEEAAALMQAEKIPVEIEINTSIRYVVPYEAERRQIRDAIFYLLQQQPTISAWPLYLRTKISIVIALLMQRDYPQYWPTAFDDMIQFCAGSFDAGQNAEVTLFRHDIFCRNIQAVVEEIVTFRADRTQEEMDRNTILKDVVRGYGSTPENVSVAEHPSRTVSHRLIEAVLAIFQHHFPLAPSQPREEELAILALETFAQFVSWVDVALICTPRVLSILYECLVPGWKSPERNSTSLGNGGHFYSSDLAVEAADALLELVSKGMEEDKKVQLIHDINLLSNLSEERLMHAMKEDADIAAKVSEVVNEVGMALLPYWDDERYGGASSNVDNSVAKPLLSVCSSEIQKMMPLFFFFFSYEDIEVATEMMPLAQRLIVSLGRETECRASANCATAVEDFQVLKHLPQLLNVMYQQMRYPSDFQFDYNDEDEAEEQIFRQVELRKLYLRIVKLCPDIALQFVCEALASLSVPISNSETSDLEASLRLVYHYSEGVTQGNTVVIKNAAFRQVVVALHNSDIVAASPNENSRQVHREVLILYYDIIVRYYLVLKEEPALLPKILEAMSGSMGLQHPHPRVRSRTTYLLLKLVKSLAGDVMRPFVETAVGGIQSLLASPSYFPMEPDDSLYLFETVGLLVGKTGVDEQAQERFLSTVLAPHINNINDSLKSPNATRDKDYYGQSLSQSVAAMAFLSKGFVNPGAGVKNVLMGTVCAALSVLQALPMSEAVRHKVMVFCQRMIQCLGDDFLPFAPTFLDLLIANCTSQDVLDVSQLMYHLCLKFKANALLAIDPALLPFLQKCQALTPSVEDVAGHTNIPPHLLAEQMSIKKLPFCLFQHITNFKVTSVLLTSRNAPHLEAILRSMLDGVVSVPDPIIKRYCLIFFRELCDQWAADGSIPSEQHKALHNGFVRFMWETVVPGMFQTILDPAFREKDAMHAKCVGEIGNVLASLKATRGAAEFDIFVMQNTVGKLLSPTEATQGAFLQASTGKQMNQVLKALLANVKYR